MGDLDLIPDPLSPVLACRTLVPRSPVVAHHQDGVERQQSPKTVLGKTQSVVG